MLDTLPRLFAQQKFANEYCLVNGVAMNQLHGDRFQIPPMVIKKHIQVGQFVELRLDSPRFAHQQELLEKCVCPSCQGELTKPVLKHAHPETLVPDSNEEVASRGWGEDFWVKVTERSGLLLKGTVDNHLFESRLHGLEFGDELVFHESNILAIHGIHRQQLILSMDDADLEELAIWLRSLPETDTK
jgi:hypothetical protein